MKTTAGSTASPTPSGRRGPSIAGRCGTSSSPARPRATPRSGSPPPSSPRRGQRRPPARRGLRLLGAPDRRRVARRRCPGRGRPPGRRGTPRDPPALAAPARRQPRGDYQTCSTPSRPARTSSADSTTRALAPLVAGDDLPPFWARRTAESLYLFFAHPKARELRYPMRYGQSLCRERRGPSHHGRLRRGSVTRSTSSSSRTSRSWSASLGPRACDSWTSDTDRPSRCARRSRDMNANRLP